MQFRCSENAPEVRELFREWAFTPRAFFVLFQNWGGSQANRRNISSISRWVRHTSARNCSKSKWVCRKPLEDPASHRAAFRESVPVGEKASILRISLPRKPGQGAAQRDAQFYFMYAALRTLFFIEQNEPFLPYNLRPREGNPLKHRLIQKCLRESSTWRGFGWKTPGTHVPVMAG